MFVLKYTFRWLSKASACTRAIPCLFSCFFRLYTKRYFILSIFKPNVLFLVEKLQTDVGELINKYTPLKSWAELDNLKWNNAPRGNVYTISWLPDYDSEQHPANVGCVEVVRMGGGVTAQILYADNFKMYIRTFLGKEDARWTAWTQV